MTRYGREHNKTGLSWQIGRDLGRGMMLGQVISTEIIEAWRPSDYFFYHAAVQVLTVLYVVTLMVRRRTVHAS